MIMDQHTALRLARMMKIGWRDEAFCGRVELRSYEATEFGPATVKVSWTKEHSAPPSSILVESTRPASILAPELYATWTGFTQAYGVKLGWRD